MTLGKNILQSLAAFCLLQSLVCCDDRPRVDLPVRANPPQISPPREPTEKHVRTAPLPPDLEKLEGLRDVERLELIQAQIQHCAAGDLVLWANYVRTKCPHAMQVKLLRELGKVMSETLSTEAILKIVGEFGEGSNRAELLKASLPAVLQEQCSDVLRWADSEGFPDDISVIAGKVLVESSALNQDTVLELSKTLRNQQLQSILADSLSKHFVHVEQFEEALEYSKKLPEYIGSRLMNQVVKQANQEDPTKTKILLTGHASELNLDILTGFTARLATKDETEALVWARDLTPDSTKIACLWQTYGALIAR
jgi:hypothetical protein